MGVHGVRDHKLIEEGRKTGEFRSEEDVQTLADAYFSIEGASSATGASKETNAVHERAENYRQMEL